MDNHEEGNPPAFPSTGEGFGNPRYGTKGMTLRDYFAGQALGQVVSDMGRDGAFARKPASELPAVIAKGAYQIADAMMAARKVKP